ncbi:hypothetical protein IWQ60_010594 [Tieghemiomyces parasiticus]|uniref:Uncharacterized protein n=1 Tax=Tieghemiomyces parasiticus TaxID=78921 RepID=A0A9W8DJF8_9FUNG|nr:hypothetical protein IWQ60_010594 [Tieghemiomyces parasiticus]
MVKIGDISESADNRPIRSGHFVDELPEGAVLVITAPHDCTNAVVGGLLAGRAKVRGARGIVADGRVRDLAELQALGLPVFARGLSCTGTRGRVRPAPFKADNGPASVTVEHGEDSMPILVTSGDTMVADVNGVMCIPAAHLARVVELCRQSRPIEERCMADIQAGHGFQKTLAKYRAS